MRNIVEEQLKNLWEIVGTRKRIYNCNKLRFPKMAMESHISHAFLQCEFDMSPSSWGVISTPLESGQAMMAI